MIGIAQMIILAFAILAVATWIVVISFAPRKASTNRSPKIRALTARAWLYAPIWVPTLLVLAAFLPALVGVVFSAADHCALHGSHHHHHLCLIHPPHAASHAFIWLVPVVLSVFVALRIIPGITRAARERSMARSLVATSRPSDLGENVRLLDQSESLALTVGWRSPNVLLSTGLIQDVSDTTLDVILAHEASHVRRRDTLSALFDNLVATLIPTDVAQALLEDIALAREQVCDEAAARRVGDPLLVAQALTEVARRRMTVIATSISMSSSSLEARVLHILEPPGTSNALPAHAIAVLVVLTLVGAFPVHSSIEYVFTYLLH